MRVGRSVLAIAVVSCVGVAVPRKAAADEWDKQTVFTFNQDVEVPGKILAAGTYVFRLADGEANRHVVQVFDENGKFLAAIMTIPATRLRAANDTRLTFDEQSAGAPLPIKTWFYAGELDGEEFVYRTHLH